MGRLNFDTLFRGRFLCGFFDNSMIHSGFSRSRNEANGGTRLWPNEANSRNSVFAKRSQFGETTCRDFKQKCPKGNLTWLRDVNKRGQSGFEAVVDRKPLFETKPILGQTDSGGRLPLSSKIPILHEFVLATFVKSLRSLLKSNITATSGVGYDGGQPERGRECSRCRPKSCLLLMKT